MIVAGVTADDEVICPSMSYVATANSIRYVGAKVVFAEVNPETYNLDVDDVREKITPKTKAILLVHQIGMPADIDAFKALCDEHNLILIEDAACAAGSAYKGKKIGSHSDLVCFSFHRIFYSCTNINYKTFNIGTGVEYTMKELLLNLLDLMDKQALGLEYLPDRPADVPRLWVKADKFYNATNFKANYSFEDGLKETIQYYVDLSAKKDLIKDIKLVS